MITAPAAHSTLSSTWAGQVTDAVTPTWWRGVLASTKTTTTSHYTSLTLTSDGLGEGLSVTADADCISLPAGVYDICLSVYWPTDADGTRFVYVIANPSATSVDSTTNVTGSELTHYTIDAPSVAFTTTTPKKRYRLGASDKFMVVIRHTAGNNLDIAANARTFLEITRVGE
jgi:hypothetical protein